MPFKPEPNLLAGPFARTQLGPKTVTVEAAGALPPPKPPGGLRVEDRIGIQAPAELIWEIVHDLDTWHEWNPTYTAASGQVPSFSPAMTTRSAEVSRASIAPRICRRGCEATAGLVFSRRMRLRNRAG